MGVLRGVEGQEGGGVVGGGVLGHFTQFILGHALLIGGMAEGSGCLKNAFFEGIYSGGYVDMESVCVCKQKSPLCHCVCVWV